MDGILNTQLELVPALATALLNSLWQCTLLAVAAATTLRVLKRHSAALRHVIGMAFLLAMAGVPAWTFLQYWLHSAGDANSSVSSTAIAPEIGAAPGVLVQPTNVWTATLCALWLIGVAYMLVRHLGGLWWVDRLDRREFGGLPLEWQTHLDELQRTMGITRKIVVRVAETVLVPFTARLFRPVIWLPLSVLTRLPREQIEALLAHELAHIHRLDWLWNGIQCFVEALLFFHPGVWWLSRRIREEREHACDEAAVSACTDAVVLSEALAALAGNQQLRSRLLLAANGSPLMKRIAHLLTGASAPPRSGALLALVVCLAAGAALLAPLGVGYAAASYASEPTESASVHVLPSTAALPVSTERTATRDSAQVTRDGFASVGETSPVREQAVGDAEEDAQAQAVRAPDAARTFQAMDTKHPIVVLPVQSAPGFTGRTGFQPVNAEAAASPAGQASQALVRLVMADPRVARWIGSPVAMTSNGFTGSWRRDEGAEIYTEVRLSFTLTGPEGRARIWASAVQADGQWTLTGLELREFTALH